MTKIFNLSLKKRNLLKNYGKINRKNKISNDAIIKSIFIN